METDNTQSLHKQAQEALSSLKRIIYQYIQQHPGSSSTDVVNGLGLHSDFEGKQKNYLSWSIIGLLVNEKKVRYEQQSDGARKYYFSNN